MDYNKISNVYVSGIDFADYPDFCDSYIESAEYDGKEMTEEQLEIINQDTEYVYECLNTQIH